MKKISARINSAINNEKGMELMSFLGLMVITVLIGAALWTSTKESLSGQMTTIADTLQSMFG